MTSITLLTKMSLIGLAIGFLSSCVTTRPVNFRYEAERCIVSERFDKCRCYDYVITPSFSGNVSDGRDEPLAYCDNLVGFSPDDWIALLNNLNAVIGKSTNQKTIMHERLPDILQMIREVN